MSRTPSSLPACLALAAGCGALAGCAADPAGPGPGGSVNTVVLENAFDVERTELGFRVDIPFRFTNPGRDPVYILGCHLDGRRDVGMALQKLDGFSWSQVWATPGRACIAPAERVDPGGGVTDTVHVELCVAIRCGPPTAGMDVNGIYRLLWTNLMLTRNGEPDGEPVRLPESFLTSGPFELRKP